MAQLGIGLQLYSVRNQLEQDFVGTLKKVAAMGYEGVEFAGIYGGLSGKELAALVQDLGLKVVGTHTSIYRLRDNLEEEVQFHVDLGAPYCVAPWLPEEFRTSAAFPEILSVMQRAGDAFSKVGIGFGYHNHDFEFIVKIDGQYMLDALFERTDATKVQAELDVGWVYEAGVDTLAYVEKYSGRLPLVHLKDFAKDSAGNWVTMPVGKGTTPIKEVIPVAEKAGSSWLIVEQDNSTGDIMQEIAESRQWLKQQYR